MNAFVSSVELASINTLRWTFRREFMSVVTVSGFSVVGNDVDELQAQTGTTLTISYTNPVAHGDTWLVTTGGGGDALNGTTFVGGVPASAAAGETGHAV